jgi:hypothetical protein
MKKNRIPSLSLVSKGKANRQMVTTNEVIIDRGAERFAQLLTIIIVCALAGLLGALTGCAHEQVPTSARSSAVIDTSLVSASSGVKKVQASLASAQDDAREIYQTYTNAVTNTVLRQDFIDLESALSESQDQLATVSTNLFTATNNLVWYEADYLATHKIAATQALTIISQEKSIVWWRSKALWGWGFISLLFLGVVSFLALKYGGPYFAKIAGAFAKAP